jgi:multiple sugar transport system substrate-binding protein
VWEEAAFWHYAAMWEDHFMPNDNYVNSDLLGQGNTFGSGNVAMTPIHTWYTCCFEDVNWDVAAIPSYEGNITAKMHADTFAIPQCSANTDAAFQVLGLMLGEFAPDLLQVYGGLPARESLQEEALATMQENFPDADLDVFIAAMNYPDNPNHEAGMPNFLKASDRYNSFASLYQSDPNLDLEAELDTLINDLQAIFDEVE